MKIPFERIAAMLCFFSFPFLLCNSLTASEAKQKPPLVLEGAEYVRQIQAGGKRTVVLDGNVRWARGESRLRCERAKFIEEDGFLFLSGDVHLVGEDRDILADSVQYFRDREYAVAMGHILVTIADGDITVRADSMDYALAGRESWAFKRPLLTLSDGDAGENEGEVTVIGDMLHMVEDSFVTIVGNVDILGDSLAGRSDSLHYDMKIERIMLFGSPWIEIGSYMLKGNRIDLCVPGRTLKRGLSTGSARGEQRKTDRGTEDEAIETVNWIEADSIALSFLDDRIDSLDASSGARSFFRLYGEGKMEENYVIGDNILIVWKDDSIDAVQVSGRGEGIYRKVSRQEE